MYSAKCISIAAPLFLCLSFSIFLFLGGNGRVLEEDDWTEMIPSRRSLMMEEEQSGTLKIIFSGPATNWTDDLPIGNGRLGAMVRGGVFSEVVGLNEDTVWTGIPGNYTNPNALTALADVRKLVDDGDYSEATAMADNDLSGNSSDVYQLLGDLKLDFDESHANYTAGTYLRELDLDTATVTVKYTVGDVEFTREHFASNPDQVIVTKISSSKMHSLSFNVSLDSLMQHQSSINGNNRIIMEGSCPGKRNWADDHQGIKFSAVLDLQIGGENGSVRNLDDHKLRVENADWAVILLVASSSFTGPFTNPSDSKKNPTSESLTQINTVKSLSYSSLYSRHLEDYQKLFHRVSLHLSRSNSSSTFLKPTSERIRSFQTDEDPSMVGLLFQYGRYLLISSSRPGTQPANLQGIWNKDIYPPWDCAPHLNINLQMNYWPSLSSNLHECHEPLLDYMSSLAINGMKTAKVNYNSSGWVVHQVSDIWAKTSPDAGQSLWAMWPMGGAWLATHSWEHYTYTMDKLFLEKKAYPLLQGAASFLLDWWIEGKDGVLETNPSTSPEHMFIAPNGKPSSVSYSSTMDVAITREVFSNIISASEVLGRRGDDIIQRVLEALSRLPPYRIAHDGAIMEWAQEFKDPDPFHRHVSHLYSVFPGHTITQENPDLCKAANYSLYKRGEDGPGWSTVWKAAIWAHLQSSEHSYRMIKHLFNLVDPDREGAFEGGLYSNLFSAHPPFQIDANFGFSAAISEMLVQSTLKDLSLLPALPQEKWPNGCVRGLKARGGLTINMCWSEGDLEEVSLWSIGSDTVTRVHYRGSTITATILAGKVYTFDRKLNCIKTSPLS